MPLALAALLVVIAGSVAVVAVRSRSSDGWVPSVEHAMAYACDRDPSQIRYDLEYTGDGGPSPVVGDGEDYFFITLGRWRSDGDPIIATEIWGSDSGKLLGWKVLCMEDPVPPSDYFWDGEVTAKADVMIKDLDRLHRRGDLPASFDWMPTDSVSSKGKAEDSLRLNEGPNA